MTIQLSRLLIIIATSLLIGAIIGSLVFKKSPETKTVIQYKDKIVYKDRVQVVTQDKIIYKTITTQKPDGTKTTVNEKIVANNNSQSQSTDETVTKQATETKIKIDSISRYTLGLSGSLDKTFDPSVGLRLGNLPLFLELGASYNPNRDFLNNNLTLGFRIEF